MPITESSLLRVSYGALAVGISALVGFVLWLSAIENKAQANSLNIKELRDDKKVELEILHSLDARTSRIEGILETMMSHDKGDK